MALDLLRDCTFFGPALPEPFVKFELEKHLRERQLLPRADGAEGRALQERWEVYRRKLRALGEQGGDLRVASHVLAPMAERLGYASFERQNEVGTREGLEDGGWLMSGADSTLRCWSVDQGTDLDAPNLRGRAYRFSPARVAQRVLLAKGERVGLLTDGEELRILICDPARPDSHIAIRLDRSQGWRAAHEAPDSYRLLLALASPSGTKAFPELTEAARLAQATVTRKLRVQARRAIEDFIQSVLDQPANAPVRATTDADELAKVLWREGLVLVYRLLFIFKLESSVDPARAFSFAATSLWRNTYSPNVALASLVRKVLDYGAETGGLLEGGLRILWRMFARGLTSRELQVSPLGGMLFGEGATPVLDRLEWGETAVAKLLDALLWTPSEGRVERERVHYGALDVEDLGRVYEALLELEPGVATEPMCRLRRAKLEVVVPAVQGEAYRANSAENVTPEEGESDSDEETEDEEERASPKKRSMTKGKTRVQFIENILPGRFYLRVGIGRKTSGSYYTPHPFVRFLVQETLGPQIAERSPQDDPQPGRILGLKVLDPAMGSGHFLVEACRFLGEALYEACRLCDELAIQAEGQAERASDTGERECLLRRARDLRQRVEVLPGPDNELVAYLPSRVVEGQESGPSQRKAHALCRRLVAVHCLYGVDKNPLAVELAKLSLWLESYAEGLPLTFLNHRLIPGDSLSGAFSGHLLTYPRNGEEIRGLFVQGLRARFQETLASALAHVRELEGSVGKDLADLEHKRRAKEALDTALEPFRILAAAWSGGVLLGEQASNFAYVDLLQAVAERRDPQGVLATQPVLKHMVQLGEAGLAYDLAFPEIFHPEGNLDRSGGFHAVLGNPPWETIRRSADQFFGSIDFQALVGATRHEKKAVIDRLLGDLKIAGAYDSYREGFEAQDRITDRLFSLHKARVGDNLAGRGTYDAYMLFSERGADFLRTGGYIGMVLPSAFHANEGSTGIRQLYLERLSLCCCFSFENRRKIFEIDSRFKFALVIAQGIARESLSFNCAFYLQEPAWLFGDREDQLTYSIPFIRRTGGEYLTFLELRSKSDEEAARKIFLSSVDSVKGFTMSSSIVLSQEINMTYDSTRFTSTSRELPGSEDPRDASVAPTLLNRGYLTLHEGKTFHQYDDHWGDRPRYLVHLSAIHDKTAWRIAAQYPRLAFRDIASSTNERTGIFCFLPPGCLFGNKAPCEREPARRPHWVALVFCAVANSFSFDFVLRTKVQATVNLFILNSCPFPKLESLALPFLAHSTLRLTCNHDGYASLWMEQLDKVWREQSSPLTWPVLAEEKVRWPLRAAIDAVVASAFQLSRQQYVHVLSTFNHRRHLAAPELCLAAFDELEALGIEDFSKRHDPYWDIPLVEDLPNPAVSLDLVSSKEPIDNRGQMLLLADKASARAPEGFSRLGRISPTPDIGKGQADTLYGLLLSFLKEHGEMTSRDAQNLADLNAADVRPYLERFVTEGLAVREGQRRGTKYRYVEN